MSSALAIAGVTAVLRDVLTDGLIDNNVSGMLGSSVAVSVLPPDRVVPANGVESPQINVFLYLVTPNAGWRNEGLPSRDASGRVRVANAPLALNLHYLVSAYTGGELHAEILLGFAMQVLHEMPVLTRESIRAALHPQPGGGGTTAPAMRALAGTGLEDQVELIKLTPEYLNTEEISKLWTAMQSHFRPTAAYTASVALIESARPLRAALPVLSRGIVDPLTRREAGVAVHPNLDPAYPMLTAIVLPGNDVAAHLGDTVTLEGRLLGGSQRAMALAHDRFGTTVLAALPPSGPDDARAIRVVLDPARAASLPVGIYRVQARLVVPGETESRVTNTVALTIAPRITNLPLAVSRDANGTARFAIDFLPPLREGQHASLILGSDAHLAQASGSPSASLAFEIRNAPVGDHLVRLRIDGIDSPIVDRSAVPPAAPVFLDQRISIT